MSVSNFILCIGDLYIPDRAIEIPPQFQPLLRNHKILHTICLGNVTDAETHDFLRTIPGKLHIVPGDFDGRPPFPSAVQPSSTLSPAPNTHASATSGSAATPALVDSGLLQPTPSRDDGSSTTHPGLSSTLGAGTAPTTATTAGITTTPTTAATTSSLPTADAGSSSQPAGQHSQSGPAASGTGPSSSLSGIIEIGSLRIGFVSSSTIIPSTEPQSLLIACREMDVDVLVWGGTHVFEAYTQDGKFFVNPGSTTGAFTTENWSGQDCPPPSFVLLDVQGDVLNMYRYQLEKNSKGEESILLQTVSYRKGQ